MSFVPHTKADIESMLQLMNCSSIEDLFSEIPKDLQIDTLDEIPASLNEHAMLRLMQNRARQDAYQLNFIGAGAYEHHIPAAVWEIASRGEFLTAYTPYQAEASQGTLQLLYEYQSMMAKLMQMDVSNASLYDGASSVAEAVLMAARVKKGKKKQLLVAGTLHPLYRQVIQTIIQTQGIEIIDVPYSPQTGQLEITALDRLASPENLALVLPQPNFFGQLEAVDELTDWAHRHQLLTIAVVNPLAMALLKPPGEWGEHGVDFVCGEGQPLGVPLASGGPYFGFLCCKQAYIRQLPGRLVGRTQDGQGRQGFTLTLQAREQHIRRSKATSNICTNQGLLVTAATIYMSLMGATGLKSVALKSHQQTLKLGQLLTHIPGVDLAFKDAPFHELVVRLGKDAKTVHQRLANQGIMAGVLLGDYFSGHENDLLLCVTETKQTDDLEFFANALSEAMEA